MKKFCLENFKTKGTYLIEASAGTGKTYTLERLYLKYLLSSTDQKPISIKNILVVTFTEKATLELKERLRSIIDTSLNENDYSKEDQIKLETAKNNFEQSCIYTIHGFCSRLLKDYAIEISSYFNSEICDVSLHIEKVFPVCFLEWQKNIPSECWQIFKKKFSPISNILEKVKGYFKSIPLGQQLSPFDMSNIIKILPPPEISGETIELLLEQYISLNQQFKNMIQNSIFTKLTHGQFLQILQDAGISGSRLREETREKIGSFLFSLTNKQDPFDFWIDNNKTTSNLEKINPSFLKEIQKKSHQGTNFPKELISICDDIKAIIIKSKNIEKIQLNLQLQSYYILLQKILEKILKEKNKYQSLTFSDIIERLYLWVNNLSNKEISQTIASQYKVVLIDEFQDTDPLQWALFKKLFFESDYENSGIIVGDPKQSIYRFRGSDIESYLEAKNYVQEVFCLDTNYRSQPYLVEAINTLIKKIKLFEESNINALTVKSGKQDYQILYKNNQPLQAIQFIEPKTSELTLQQNYIQSYTQTIYEILSPEKNYRFKSKDQSLVPIKPKDICILCRTKDEGRQIQQALLEKNISCHFEDEDEIFLGDIATEFTHILEAIQNPHDSSAVNLALFTSLCGFKIKTIDEIELAGHQSYFASLRTKWRDLSLPQVFKSLKNQFNFMTRSYSITSFIIKKWLSFEEALLHQEFISETTTPKDLSLYLQSHQVRPLPRQNTTPSLQQESIQIITIHKAKGLEFPLCFVLGLTHSSNSSIYYRFREKNQLCFDLAKEEENAEKEKSEIQEEEKRLLYVAITRASSALFLPLLNSKTNARMSLGSLMKNWHLYLDIEKNNSKYLFSKWVPDTAIQTQKSEKIDSSIDLKDLPNFLQETSSITSFSTLISNKPFSTHTDSSEREQDEHYVIDTNTSEVYQDFERLPAGAKTGNLLHDVLENTAFLTWTSSSEEEYFKNSEYQHSHQTIIEKSLKEHHLSKDYLCDAQKIIYNTLNKKISFQNTTFKLANCKQTLKEMEFLLKTNPKQKPSIQLSFGEKQESYNYRSNYLKGFVDLIFKHHDKYFIADWKSNDLGIDLDNYQPKNLINCMQEHHYNLQYMLYIAAFLKIIVKIKPNFDYEKDFGGVYYFFLRGMNTSDLSNRGYFYDLPTKKDIQYFCQQFLKESIL